MDYAVQLVEVAARPLAVARGAAGATDLGAVIIKLLDRVWPVLREQHVATGHNVVVYLDGRAHIEAGVEVFGDFQPTADVYRSSTPSGLAVSTVHWGEYSEMAGAYAAITRWSVENKQQLDGLSWEVYGDWSPSPEQQRTDIFLLVRAT